MQEDIHIIESDWLWDLMRETPYPPEVLYIRGDLGDPDLKRVTIVGSRKCSEYAKQVVEEICTALEGQPVSIVSGLAHGVDAHAHACALEHGLHTIAVLGSSLVDPLIYPKQNFRLAMRILKAGGALVSECAPEHRSQVWTFPARNRLMVGMSQLVIIIEAREKSGTLITARLATDYNRDLMVVPNSIYSTYSKGSNELMRQGAYVYTKPEDIFDLLGLKYEEKKLSRYEPSAHEQTVIDAIVGGATMTPEILTACTGRISTAGVVQALLNLEIEGVIKRVDGRYIVI
jgi:DNA processing protein